MTPTPVPAIPILPSDRPLLLLPVRLETRFFPDSGGGTTLKVRVFPDTIYADTHEPGVTLSEAEWGRHYWQTVWRASTDEERRKAAWRQLAERYEPQRASWVIWHTRPLNPDDQPDHPIAADAPLNPEPRFPEPPQLNVLEESWTRPPWSRVLPDRWLAVGYLSGAVIATAQGNDIPDSLPLGPSPKSDLTTPDDQIAVDDGMKWLVDFDEALRVGMGLQLVLPPSLAALDRLIVYGVKSSLNNSESAGRVAELVAAQSYTRGFSFLAPGTPSNNTVDAASGFSSFDPGYDTSFRANQAQSSPSGKSNGGLTAQALGIPADQFTRMERAHAEELTNARHMNTVLWQATWGYFLDQMMSGALRESDREATINWVRKHFAENVRASGPLPAIRCGRQPYGILPVTSMDLWQPRAADGPQTRFEADLVSLLSRLRPTWMRASFHVAQVNKTNDPEQDLLAVLRLQPSSETYSIRSAVGWHYFQNLWQFQFINLEGAGWWARVKQLVDTSLNVIGFPGVNTRLQTTAYAGIDVPLKAPLVQAGTLLEDTRLTPNFVEWLLESTVTNIRNESFAEPKPKSLLYALLRHSTLMEYTKAGQNLLLARGLMNSAQRREAEIIDVDSNTMVFTPWKQLATVVPDISPQPLEVFLHQLTTFEDSTVAQLGDFRSNLRELSSASVPELERLMTGTLDLCSYRLDAWITSIATRRLAAMRQDNPNGVYLGGYGWLENLKPVTLPAAATTVPEEAESPAFALPDNPGFIHAPSLAQAATAAVLRNGHVTHQNVEAGKLLSLDLSSARVRLAKWLLDGVRAGQPLGALLGYRFERGLHEGHPGIELDKFIARFREMAPLAARKLDPATGMPVEAIAANNVVDALKLQRLWKQTLSNEAAFFAGLGEMTDAQRDALRAEIRSLDDAVDAVSDALIAESVHQAVQGDAPRASTTLDAVARGDARPPELDVIETPRSGIALTHRVLALFSGPPSVSIGWTPGRFPFRAEAEPHLNAWAGQLLGDPALVRFRVELLDRATGNVAQTREIRLKDLALSPLDLVYAAESNAQIKRSEIEQRLLLEMVRQAPDFGPYDQLRVQLDRDPAWNLTDLSGLEFFELLRTVRALITRARGIDGRDLVAAGVDGASGTNETDLNQRAARALESLRQALAELKAAAVGPNSALSDTLLKMAHFGLSGAVPEDPAQWTAQAQSVEREAASRLSRAELASTPVEVVREVFGSSFVIAPIFTPPNAAELTQTWASSTQLQGGDPAEVLTWFGRAARVRDGVSRMEDAFRLGEALATGTELNLRVGQLPLRESDRWVALSLTNGKPLAAGTLSLVAQTSDQFDATAPLAGLLIDEWIETVPNPTETTAVAFQYDQPDSTPPQSLLIAIPPRVDEPWTADTLQRVLVETMDLAKMRVVDPSLLGEIQHFLPALHFASNVQGDTVSTDWTPLTR